MNTSAPSLLARARAYMQHQVGRTALTVAPLAAVGMMANTALAQDVTFDPGAAITYGGDTSGFYSYDAAGGTLTGSQVLTNSHGATFSGAVEDDNFNASGGANFTGSVTMFSINGNITGTVDGSTNMAQIGYEFTLTTSNGTPVSAFGPVIPIGTPGLSITGGTLALTVGGLTTNVPVSGLGANVGVIFIPIGARAATYSAVLTVNYAVDNTGVGPGTSITANVPPFGSIDFQPVPEPGTWVVVAAGVLGAGAVRLARQRRVRTVPAA